MKKARILAVALLMTICTMVRAQNDPVLAGMIIAYTDKAESQLKAQERTMLMMSTGHVWTKEEVDGVYQFQKDFNDYLDTFRSIIVYASQIYGFYHEIDKLVKNVESYGKQLDEHPTNALAVALSSRRNGLYRDVIMNGVDIVNDIRVVCLGKIKTTEKQRMEIVFGIRPKLKLMNKKLQLLTKMVRYTTMNDIWYELTEKGSHQADKAEIARECMRRWRRNCKQ